MIFSIEKVQDSGLEKLHNLVITFFEKMFSGLDFDDCIETDLSTVLSGSPTSSDFLSKIHRQYVCLSVANQDDFQDLFENHLDLTSHYSDNSLAVTQPVSGLEKLWKACKDAGSYLYSTTLGLECFQTVSRTTMDQHFESYRRINGSVCCFCGMEEYEVQREISYEFGNEHEKQWRASYDHLLCRSKYPLLAIDFDNLVPTCRVCNERAKGQKDLLYSDGARTISFCPYVDEETVNIELRIDVDTGGFEVDWRIDFSPTDTKHLQKMQNWNRVYKVKERLANKLRSAQSLYYGDVLFSVDSALAAKEKLLGCATAASSQERLNPESFLKSLCLNEVASQEDHVLEYLISAADFQYSGRSF
jgi:hypothetical protein